MTYELIHADCLKWLADCAANSFHACITDPPYGLIEYNSEHLTKLRNGRGGVWRIPPTFDGSNRQPLPRFTVLTQDELNNLSAFFLEWAKLLLPTLVPGAHVFIASNPLVSHLVWTAMTAAGFEKRGEIIRLVRTFRGGDRPKGAEDEFPEISAMPRSAFEPWGLFRRPFELDFLTLSLLSSNYMQPATRISMTFPDNVLIRRSVNRRQAASASC